MLFACEDKKRSEYVFITYDPVGRECLHLKKSCKVAKSAGGIKQVELKKLSEVHLTCPDCVSEDDRNFLEIYASLKEWRPLTEPVFDFQQSVYHALPAGFCGEDINTFKEEMYSEEQQKRVYEYLCRHYEMPPLKNFREDFFFRSLHNELGSVLYTYDFERIFGECICVPEGRVDAFENSAMARARKVRLYRGEQVYEVGAKDRKDFQLHNPDARMPYLRK